ncbi:hypothetical protein, partial [Paramuribaculum intestinale]|uniref:hypothetical protein n=1 Tax=Paramuribaculum intestinale TaxID=2094151 RepID=UPI0025A9BBDA
SDGFLFVMRECSRSYMTEEQTKRRWKDSQKQSDMNFRQSLSVALEEWVVMAECGGSDLRSFKPE